MTIGGGQSHLAVLGGGQSHLTIVVGGGQSHLTIGAGACSTTAGAAAVLSAEFVALAFEGMAFPDGEAPGVGRDVAAFTASEAIAIAEGIETVAGGILEYGGGGGDDVDFAVSDGIDEDGAGIVVGMRVSTTERPMDGFRRPLLELGAGMDEGAGMDDGGGIDDGAGTEAASVD